MNNYDIIVVGSGPGGYVTAIRASQLGFKTAVVEKESLGGVCLNWGCIPTKALLKSAQVFEYLNHAEDYGLNAENISHDFTKVVKRSRNVASGMSKGVNFLMKKNKIDVLKGYGKLKKDKTVSVDGTDYKAKYIIICDTVFLEKKETFITLQINTYPSIIPHQFNNISEITDLFLNNNYKFPSLIHLYLDLQLQ